MNIYPSEITDGLESKLQACSAIAYTCNVTQIAEPNIDQIVKAKAIKADPVNFDMIYINAILASVGINKNDDVFLPEEIWKAKDTPVYKQFNYMHNETDIIGAIINSAVLDTQGNIIEDIGRVNDISDIATQAVIWTNWSDPDLNERMQQIVADIQDGKFQVSMECLFKDFDYLLVSKATSEKKMLTRDAQTAFLTKYLRGFGGTGEYQSYKVYRILRNYIFSGKGLVTQPANERSIIDDNIALFTSKSEHIMTVGNTEETLKDQLAKAQVELVAAKAEMDKMKEEKEAEAAKDMEKLKCDNTALAAQVEQLKQLVAEIKAEAETARAAVEARANELQTALDAAKAQIASMESDKVVASRVAELVAVNVESAKAEEIVKTWASVTNEQFASIVELYARNKQTESGEGFNISQATQTTASVNLNSTQTAGETQSVTTESAAVQLAKTLKFVPKKKG